MSYLFRFSVCNISMETVISNCFPLKFYSVKEEPDMIYEIALDILVFAKNMILETSFRSFVQSARPS